jgi:autotransporter-associated beta strand protein
MKVPSTVLLLVAILTAAVPRALAQTYVWDASTDAGYQNASGTWGVDSFWTTNTGTGSGTVLNPWSNNAIAWLGGNATAAGSPTGDFTLTVSGTQVSAGIRQIQNGAGNFTLQGGEIQANSFRADTNTLTINSVIGSYTNAANARVDFSAQPVGGAGTLLILGGNNTLTNAIGIAGASSGGGTVRLNHQNALGLGNSVTWVHNTALDLNGFSVSGKQITASDNRTVLLLNGGASNAVWSGNVVLTNTVQAVALRAGGTNGAVEISGIISGGSGNSVQSQDNGTLRLSGANTYDGLTSVRNGSTLIVGNASALGSTNSGTTINNAANTTVDLNGFNVGNEAFTLAGANSRLVNNNTSNAATVAGSITTTNGQIGGSGNLTASGVISSATAAGFTKVGTGTATLSGNNTYTGTTTVSAGSLIINGNQSAATGVLNVAANATLGGSGTIGGATTIAGILAPGNSAGLLTFNSSLALSNSATTVMEINGAGTRGSDFDAVNVVGLLTYDGALSLSLGTTFGFGSYSFDLFDFGSTSGSFDTVDLAGNYSGSLTNTGGVWGLTSVTGSLTNTWTFTESSGVLAVEVVPEPSTYALLVLAAVGLGAHVIRRRRSA